MAGTTCREPVDRGGEIGAFEIGSGGDGVELQVVGGEDGAGASLDATRPPCTLVSARIIQPHDGVLPDGIRVQRATDERQIVQVERTREEARAHRDERTLGEPPDASVRPRGQAGGRPEVVDLVRVPRARDVDDSARGISREAGRVGEAHVGDDGTPLPGLHRDQEVLVLARHEESHSELRERLPPRAANDMAKQAVVHVSGLAPLTVSRKIRSAPAACKASSCNERS